MKNTKLCKKSRNSYIKWQRQSHKKSIFYTATKLIATEMESKNFFFSKIK